MLSSSASEGSSLNSNVGLSLPFTDGINIYQDFFEDAGVILDLKKDLDLLSGQEDMTSTSEKQAATALLDNALWTGVQKHVVVQNETRGRTIIDLVLVAAIEMAQDEVASNDFVDKSLSKRHGFDVDDKKKYPGVQSWILLYQEVNIPDQDLKVGLSCHGILNYMVAIVPKKMFIPNRLGGKTKLVGTGISGLLSPERIAKSIAYIQEAKSLTTMESIEAEAQVIVQEATICRFTKRSTVINVLTNGIFWTFYIISKIPKPREGEKREKLFRYSQTRTLSVVDPQDLAIILRLLKAAILFSPEEFASGRNGRQMTFQVTDQMVRRVYDHTPKVL
ncbi:hypothetical protein DFH09DRAFT_1361569 [Mycena vulgaris]|nr:hypothetical protein DFH09DRAFT_1361569 [Mycena vulgaris]